MFSTESPGTVRRLAVLRVPPGARIGVELLSADFVRLATHFAGRTFLCPEGEECDACVYLPSRCYWYLPALCLATQTLALLELSSSASADLEQKVRFGSGAFRPGAQVQISRRTKTSPLRVEFCQQSESKAVPALFEWVSPLMALYRLPPLARGESLASYGDRVRSRVVSRAKLAASELRAASAGRSRSRVSES